MRVMVSVVVRGATSRVWSRRLSTFRCYARWRAAVEYGASMAAEGDELPVPNFVTFPLFPFEGDLRVKHPPPLGEEWVRQGDPGGAPCQCPTPVEEFVWYDDTWAVQAASPRAVVLVFLVTRAHGDIEQLSDDEAAGLGHMIVRIERAIRAA